MSTKVIVAGCRDFYDYAFLESRLDCLLSQLPNPTIVSGGARGTDTLAIRYANARGLKLEVFPADWNKYRKAAGHIRNREMALHSTHLVAFWDGLSYGTRNMIQQAHSRHLQTRIIRIKL